MPVFFIDGQFVDSTAATLPATDLAVLRGFGVFDFLRTYSGQPFRLVEHVQRLKRSAELIGLEYDWSIEDICDIVMQTLAHNDHGESNIRIVVTGGVSSDNITPDGDPALMVMVTPAHKLPEHWYSDGAQVVTVPIERFVPGAKSTNYIPAIMALKQARAAGAIEAIYRSPEGAVYEGTTTNLFIFRGDQLLTPTTDAILPGITRQTIIELASAAFDVVECDLTLDDVYGADEVFITASNKEVVPIVQVDDQRIGTGQPGLCTRQVMALFRAETDKTAAARS